MQAELRVSFAVVEVKVWFRSSSLSVSSALSFSAAIRVWLGRYGAQRGGKLFQIMSSAGSCGPRSHVLKRSLYVVVVADSHVSPPLPSRSWSKTRHISCQEEAERKEIKASHAQKGKQAGAACM